MDISKGKYWDKAYFHGNVTTRPDRLDIPLKRKKPTVYAVWSDLFHEKVSFRFIRNAFINMQKAPQHTFLILTKRPKRMEEFVEFYAPIPENEGFAWGEDYKSNNIWLGVTAEDQPQGDKRIPILLQTPAAKRFISIEPCLGDMDISKYLHLSYAQCLLKSFYHTGKFDIPGPDIPLPPKEGVKLLDWVIVGAESGPKRRECRLEWIRFIVQQCQAANVPVFVKQLHIKGKLVKDINLFPPDLRIRELPWENTT